MKSLTRLRARAREVALESYINPKDDFLDKVEEELEKTITPEFVERIRSELVKKNKNPKSDPKYDNDHKVDPKVETKTENKAETKTPRDLFTETPPRKRAEPTQ
jgi:hypothetical protein